MGNKINLYSGTTIDLMNPSPEDIKIEDIAHALSNICRFGGHTPFFYSVAEHSMLALWCAYKDGLESDARKAILFHDATEAYLGDVVRPLKQNLDEYTEVESRMEACIGEALSIDFCKHREAIKKYDHISLRMEMTKFWPEKAPEGPEDLFRYNFEIEEQSSRSVKTCFYFSCKAYEGVK